MTRLILAVAGTVLGVGVVIMASDSDAKGQAASQNVVWEQSESVSVRLAVKGREWQAESVEADCFVDGPKQKNATNRSARKWTIVRDQQQALYFPEDFHRKPLPGEYEWGCTVAGRTIGQGRFVYVSADEARVLRP